MKFRKIKMQNFMRYKGENIIEFSCDVNKNVTVVLGDNTVGKTTLAQAFRWVLYGELINTQYEKQSEMTILNYEVLGDMGANDHKDVEVELEFEEVDANGNLMIYRIVRKSMFARKYPQLVAIELGNSLKIYITDTTSGITESFDNKGEKPKDDGKVDELISELLPQNLSSYFLFDGERWSDEKNTKLDIKDSIYTLVGISPIREMKRHLNECGTQGRSAVIKQLKSKIKGTGEEYKKITDEIEHLINNIENEEKNIEDAHANVENYQRKVDEKEELLNENPNVEQDQKEYKEIGKRIESNKKQMEVIYADIVTNFSKSHVYFAAPLLQQIVAILDNVDMDGVDIPGVTDKTIDYLLEKGECLCGHKIEKGSKEEKELLELRKLVPPAVIGTIAGNFKNKISQWECDSQEIKEMLVEKAELYQTELNDMLDNEEALEKKEKKIDRKINFAEERKTMNNLKKRVKDEQEKARIAELNIHDYRNKITEKEAKQQELVEKSEKNKKIERVIAYAEELYRIASNIYQKKENELVNELNTIVEKNFGEMFNEQEKIAKLGSDYSLHLYYKRVSNTNGYSDLEATGLSEGEKIAKNFAFIVSILELASKEKENGDKGAQTLPLVLDGPFSKLSSLNTSKVAKVLPEVADQVIIFMLDKDWEPSGLQRFTDKKYMYRTMKDVDGNSSRIGQNVEE